jgi:hypothetical protein
LNNEGGNNLNMLFLDIDCSIPGKPQGDMLYFHACRNRSVHPTPGKDFETPPESKLKELASREEG